MSLDKDTVRRIATLARIRIDEEALEPLAGELNNILGWVEQLNEVDTNDVPPMTSVVETELFQRTDRVDDGGRVEDVLANVDKMAGGDKVTSEFWIEPMSVRNIDVREYESQDRGNSARSGKFILEGTLFVQPKGYTWSMEIPFRVPIDLSEHDRSGTIVFNAAIKRGLDQMVITAASKSYKTENAVLKLLGRVPQVPYED